MINVQRILKQSWHILWNYRVLWIFGLLMALTIGGGGGGGPRFTMSANREFPGIPDRMPRGEIPEWMRELGQWAEANLVPLLENPEQHVSTFVWIGVGLVLFILAVSLLIALVRYPAETAAIRMVDSYEQSGTKLGFRAGWRLGWSRRAFRIWVIDLILGLPVFAFLLVVLVVGLLIFFSVNSISREAAVLSSVAAIGGFFLFLLVFILVMVFLGLLRSFFMRAAALENLGVIDSMRSGWKLFRDQWKNAGLMWLVMLGIGIGFGLVGVVLFFLLIPAYILLLIPAVAAALLPGLLAYGITSLFASNAAAWVIAILAALPVFFAVLFSPLLLISGWYHIFQSSVWTLTYREMKNLNNPDTLARAIAGV